MTLQVTIRYRSGLPVRKELGTWGQINDLVRELSKTASFPLSTVLTVKYKESGTVEKFSARGGGGEPVKLVKLNGQVRGLPARPDQA